MSTSADTQPGVGPDAGPIAGQPISPDGRWRYDGHQWVPHAAYPDVAPAGVAGPLAPGSAVTDLRHRPTAPYGAPTKNPAVALLLGSLIFPGLGYAYLRSWRAGAATAVVFFWFVFLGIVDVPVLGHPGWLFAGALVLVGTGWHAAARAGRVPRRRDR